MRTFVPRIALGRILPLTTTVAALLLLLMGGAGSAAPAPASGSEDLYFLPDGTQMVGQVRIDQIMNSDALKQVWTAFPDAKKAFDQAASQSSGIDVNIVDRLYFGAAKADFSAKEPPAAIAIIHYKNSVKVEDFEAALKKGAAGGPFAPAYTFTDTKVGRYTMTEVKMTLPAFNPPPGVQAPPPPPPTPIPVFAFTMPDDKRLVMGTTAALQAVLNRDAKPELNDKLKAVIKQTDFDASIAFAANVKDGFAMPAGGAQSIPLPIDKVDGLSVTVKIDKDVDVNLTAMCPDAASAAELSGGLKTAIGGFREQLKNPKPPFAGAPTPKPAPPEVLDLLDVTPQVSGSNVTVAKTVKVAALISLIKTQLFAPVAPSPGR